MAEFMHLVPPASRSNPKMVICRVTMWYAATMIHSGNDVDDCCVVTEKIRSEFSSCATPSVPRSNSTTGVQSSSMAGAAFV